MDVVINRFGIVYTATFRTMQAVLETFPGSFGNVSCIKNTFGTVYMCKQRRHNGSIIYNIFDIYRQFLMKIRIAIN
jgi:hypothetical protein